MAYTAQSAHLSRPSPNSPPGSRGYENTRGAAAAPMLIAPRYNELAEKGCIAAIMADQSLFYKLDLNAFYFTNALCQTAYFAFSALAAKNEEINRISVVQKLMSNPTSRQIFEQHGGEKAIEEIVRAQRREDQPVEIAQMIKSNYQHRLLILEMESALQLLKSDAPPMKMCAEIVNRMTVTGDKMKGIQAIAGASIRMEDKEWRAVGDDHLEKMRAIRRGEITVGFRFGIARLDKKISSSTSRGLFFVIGGMSGLGKTAMMCAGIVAKIKEGKAVFIIEMEMSRYQFELRLIASIKGIEMDKLNDPRLFSDEEFAELEAYRMGEFQEMIGQYLFGVFGKRIPVDEACMLMRQAQTERGIEIDCCFVDYIEKFSPTQGQGDERQQANYSCQTLIDFGKDNGPLIIALAQVQNSKIRKNPDGTFENLTMHDLAASSMIAKDADCVVMLNYVQKIGGGSKLIQAGIDKTRNGAMEDPEILHFEGRFMRMHQHEENLGPIEDVNADFPSSETATAQFFDKLKQAGVKNVPASESPWANQNGGWGRK